MDDLNTGFRRHGYSTVSTISRQVGGAFDFIQPRWRFGIDVMAGSRDYKRLSDGGDYHLSDMQPAFHIGYAVVRADTTCVFLSFGVGGRFVRTRLGLWQPQMLDDEIDRYEMHRDVEKVVGLMFFGVGFDHIFSAWKLGEQHTGILVGARLGYVQQFAQGGWHYQEPGHPDIHGGPPINLSGPFVRLSLGVATEPILR